MKIKLFNAIHVRIPKTEFGSDFIKLNPVTGYWTCWTGVSEMPSLSRLKKPSHIVLKGISLWSAGDILAMTMFHSGTTKQKFLAPP